MVLIAVFILWAGCLAVLYVKGRNRYEVLADTLDKKQYPLRFFMPSALYLMDIVNYCHKSNYDRKLLKSFAEIYGSKNSLYNLRMHWANKLGAVFLGLLIVLFISGIISLQEQLAVGSPNSALDKDMSIMRPAFGEGSVEIPLEAKIRIGEKETSGNYTVKVNEMPPLTEEEKQVTAVRDILSDKLIAGGNMNLQNVTEPLSLPGDDRELGGYGVIIKWTCNGKEIKAGRVRLTRPEYGTGKKTLAIEAELSKGKLRVSKVFKVTLPPQEKPKTDHQYLIAAKLELEKFLGRMNYGEQNSAKKLQLPTGFEDLKGLVIEWLPEKVDEDRTWLIVLVFGILILPVLVLGFDNDLDKRIKQRRQELQMDFPEFLNKLTLLINAGMTVGRAWDKIVSDNRRDSVLAREVEAALMDIKAGRPEAEAYEDFGKRCRIPEITRFVSVILQNMKKGNSELVAVLRLQAADCWEMRKNAAKRLGEEASTKMLLPMMIMFLAILIIVGVPAILAMQGL